MKIGANWGKLKKIEENCVWIGEFWGKNQWKLMKVGENWGKLKKIEKVAKIGEVAKISKIAKIGCNWRKLE